MVLVVAQKYGTLSIQPMGSTSGKATSGFSSGRLGKATVRNGSISISNTILAMKTGLCTGVAGMKNMEQ